MKKSERRMLLLFLAPVILVFFGFFLYPTTRTVFMSFFKVKNLAQPLKDWVFVGAQNYRNLLKNPLFLISFKNVIKIGVFGGIAVFVVALFFATTLSSNIRGKGVWRAIVYLPNIITPVALITMWNQYIFNNEYGLFHNLFSFLGLEKLANLPWTSTEYAFPAMMIAYCFGSVGYYMVIYMAAMEQIPQDFYDFAALEGAGRFYMFRKITLPLLRDTTKTTLTFWAMGSINFFLWSRLFSINELEPNTLVPANLMYSMAFGSANAANSNLEINVGAGSAVGVVLSLSVIIVYAVINFVGNDDALEF